VRPLLHFTADRGWLNDPNGLVELGGVHHLFFQHHPHDVAFGLMRWGHAVSRDLLTWTELESALVPGEPGPTGEVAPYDRDGVWSGCAVVVDGDVLFLYTAVAGETQLPCLARADGTDLLRLHRYEGNPVIPAPPAERTVTAFRDHALRRDGALWRQVIGAGTLEGRGSVFAYASPDLVQWDEEGLMLEAAAWDLPGDIWECPDLVVQGTRAVLVVSCIGDPFAGIEQPVLWIGGTLDPAGGGRLVPDTFGLFDLGPRFYAPQSYVTADGRRVLFGWLREHLEPGPDATPPSRERVGIMSLPRELTLVDGRPFQTPAGEVDAARSAAPLLHATVHDGAELDLTALDPSRPDPSRPDPSRPDPAARDAAGTLGQCFELEITVDGDLGADAVVLTLAGPGADHDTTRPAEDRFSIDLGALVRDATAWRRLDGAWSPTTFPARRARILVDRGVVEVFLDNGSAAAWTPVHLPELSTVAIHLGSPDLAADVTLWQLTRP
jgi:beta-fructofuranosidase